LNELSSKAHSIFPQKSATGSFIIPFLLIAKAFASANYGSPKRAVEIPGFFPK